MNKAALDWFVIILNSSFVFFNIYWYDLHHNPLNLIAGAFCLMAAIGKALEAK